MSYKGEILTGSAARSAIFSALATSISQVAGAWEALGLQQC